MATLNPTGPTKPLTTFRILTLDIYGTLIDWEGAIYDQLAFVRSQLPASHQYAPASARLAFLNAFHRFEAEVEREHPGWLYSAVLTESCTRLAASLDIPCTAAQAQRFGAAVGEWPAFADTVRAMQTLGKYYKLVPVSNVDKESFSKTRAGPLAGVRFDAVYTAQDIGSYKPDLRNFEYLIKHVKEDFGFEKDEILHTAQSLTHDHVPAKSMGMYSAWIARYDGKSAMGGNEELAAKVAFGWKFASLGEMAAEVEKQFNSK